MCIDVHDDEDSADDNALHAAAQDRVRDDGQRLVHDHVREEERDEQQVPVLADGLDLVSIQLLFPACSTSGNDSGDHSLREPQSRTSDQEAGGCGGRVLTVCH